MEHSVILNIETSGLDPEQDSIIGIYAIEIDERLQPTGHIFFTRLKEWQTFNQIRDEFFKLLKIAH